MDYIFFGIQGAGKGTQGKILTEKTGAAYFETGGELRRLSAEDSDLGRKVKSIIDAGHLVPNEVVMEIVANFCTTVAQGAPSVIFDGIPRNKIQSDTFEALLNGLNRPYTGVYFELTRENAENRLLKRRLCSKCKTIYPAMYANPTCEKCGGELVTRADDNADAIRTRIEIFYKETLPVIEEWASREKMIRVNGQGTIEEVSADMFKKLT